MKGSHGKAVPTKTRRPKGTQHPAPPVAAATTAKAGAVVPGRLVCFLYLLMRDTVAAGEVARLTHESMPDVHSSKAEAALKVTYSNKHLEAYAREVAEELCLDDR